ncbi:MAG: transporter substrate-binding domain-containing protein [Treponema sp.]|nr:transporter substrate-binding domain-containing protein [Treponema sp.]
MKKTTAIIFALAALVLATTSFVGCKKKDNADGKIVIRAATKGTAKPYILRDEENNLDGYDIAVFRAVFDRLPQYKVDLIISADALTGLLSGQYDISVNNWSYNDKRAESYYYSYPYDTIIYDFIQRKGDKPLVSFKDAADRGYRYEGQAGNNATNAIERWNENHPDNQIKLTYSEAGGVVYYQHILDGVADFHIDDHPIVLVNVENFGLDDFIYPNIPQEAVVRDITDSLYSFFLFPKDEKGAALREDVNKALKELHDDGTLRELSLKYFKQDQVPPADRYVKPIN